MQNLVCINFIPKLRTANQGQELKRRILCKLHLNVCADVMLETSKWFKKTV